MYGEKTTNTSNIQPVCGYRQLLVNGQITEGGGAGGQQTVYTHRCVCLCVCLRVHRRMYAYTCVCGHACTNIYKRTLLLFIINAYNKNVSYMLINIVLTSVTYIFRQNET